MTVAAAVLLFSAGSLAAQGPDGQKMTPEQRAERMTRRMTEQLSLSDEQARQIERILLDRFKEMPQAPRRPAGEPSARPSDRRFGPGAEQRQEMDEQIKSVLTDAQYQKMDRDASRYENPARLLAWTQTGARKARPTDLRFGLSLCGGRFGLIVSCGRLSVSGSEVRSPCGGGGKQSAFLHDRAKKSCRERFSRHVRPWLLAPVAVVWASFRESPFRNVSS